jgi:proteasome lid subunit RPN8/RPN11
MDNCGKNGFILEIPTVLLEKIHQNGEKRYPEEGAGLLLGNVQSDRRVVKDILLVDNIREASARRRRYAISPQDFAAAEDEAELRGLEVLGVFHSHPDHPELPSDFDREWAMPWFSYLITRVIHGRAEYSRSWRLSEDRTNFIEEALDIAKEKGLD